MPLSARQSKLVAIHAALPMVGFGIMDNAIMLIAGDQIDASFGVVFGLSTMAAAGIGNLLSDIIGLGAGNTIETIASKLGIPSANLSASQHNMPSTLRVIQLWRVIGISIGCLLGMFPLLFMATEEERRLAYLRKAFCAIDTDHSGYIEINDLKEMLSRVGLQLTEEQIKAFIEEYDMYKNKKLNFEEFVIMEKSFRESSNNAR